MTAYFPWFLTDAFDIFPSGDEMMVDAGLQDHHDSEAYVPSTNINKMGVKMYYV